MAWATTTGNYVDPSRIWDNDTTIKMDAADEVKLIKNYANNCWVDERNYKPVLDALSGGAIAIDVDSPEMAKLYEKDQILVWNEYTSSWKSPKHFPMYKGKDLKRPSKLLNEITKLQDMLCQLTGRKN